MRSAWRQVGSVSALMLVGVMAAACTSKNPAAADTPADDGGADVKTVTCQTDPRAQTYTANMEQMGASGALKFVLVQADPSPPTKGSNAWTLRVTDASKTTPAGTTVDVSDFMPDHGHGSSVTPMASAAADGSFAISGLYLFMPGIWRVTFTAHAGTVTDTTNFFFCIEG